MSEKKWKHDELLADLAEHLTRPERMMWRDMQLGPSGSPRPDVFTIRKSYTNPDPRAYEIKVSVADFRSDVTGGKWQNYLRYARGVTFCVPVGLVSKADLPPGAGLMTRSENGWRTAKAPTLGKLTELPTEMLLKLLIDGLSRLRREMHPERVSTYLANKNLRESLGDDVADAIADLSGVRLKIASHEDQLARERANSEKIEEQRRKHMEQDLLSTRHSLVDALELPRGSPMQEIREAVQTVKLAASCDELVSSAAAALTNAIASLERQRSRLNKVSG